MAIEDQYAERRPPRHLRVGLGVGETEVRLESVWLVEEPPVRNLALAHPIVVSIEVAGRPSAVEAHPDPRVTRSTMKPDVGHHYGRTREGTLYVSVPFESAAELDEVEIRVADLGGTAVGEPSPERLAALLRHPVEGSYRVHRLSGDDLRKSPDWAAIAVRLGIAKTIGRFEIYLDRAERYRWRLLRGSSEIVADSGEGYPTREACLNDLNWIRAHAGTLRAVSRDAPGGGHPAADAGGSPHS